MQAARELIALANECWVSRCLHAAVDLRLADALGDQSLTIAELSAIVGAEASSVEAVVRVLAGRDIFVIRDGKIAQTEASQLLRENHAEGIREIVSWLGAPESWMALQFLPEAVVRRRSGFELAFGQGLFEYLAKNIDRHIAFSRSMEAFTRKEVQAVLAAIDLSAYSSIVDLWGGTGILAKEIARHYPNVNVTIFELPGIAPSASELPSSVSVSSGNFFEDPLPRADLTILMNVLHDWSDEDAVRLLAAVRRCNDRWGHICVIEGLMGSGERIDMVNLGMMVMTGGRQRRRAELDTLFESAGYAISSEANCSHYLSVLIAHAVAA